MFKNKYRFLQQQSYVNSNKYLRQPRNIKNIVEKTKDILGTPKVQFQRPKTQDEWLNFHKINEEGIKKAYEKPEGYHIDGNKLFIAGTKDFNDVLDWGKIPLGTFKDSKIYKNIEPVFKDNPQINYVVGHSAGGSATLELEKNHPERTITSITYNAPVFEYANLEKLLNEDKKPMRFAITGDPVSMFDFNAQTTAKAPEFNVDAITNMTKAYTDPSPGNIEKVVKGGMPDFTLGLHKMEGSYSNPSKPMDFVKSGANAIAVGKALGVV